MIKDVTLTIKSERNEELQEERLEAVEDTNLKYVYIYIYIYHLSPTFNTA